MAWQLLFAGCAILALAAADATEKDVSARLIRQEGKRIGQAMVLPGGMLAETKRHSQAPATTDATTDATTSGAGTSDTRSDTCDMIFVLGTGGTNDCPAGASLIDRLTICGRAAEVMDKTKGHDEATDPFKIQFDDYDRPKEDWPKGCLTKSDADGALFFNSHGDMPNNVESHPDSKPVCFKPKYHLGSNDTNDCDSSTETLVRVVDREECRSYATCMGQSPGNDADFTVGVACNKPCVDERFPGSGDFNAWPKGCFINHDDQNVYWNEPASDDSAPTGPKGTPICKVAPDAADASPRTSWQG